jgi:site-specific recombinase XerD
VVLGPTEVLTILSKVRLLRYRVCVSTIYSCGLCVREGTSVQIPDADSAGMVLPMHGKSSGDRYVPLPSSRAARNS